MTHTAWLGTGLLGSGFVEAACGRGEAVTVWNRTLAKARALEPFGATVAETPAQAVEGAARIHLVLRDDAVVEEVIAALRPGLAEGAILVDHTTTLPATTAERATRLIAEGVRYLHCPVFIGPASARQGLGTILVAGPRALYESVRPALELQAGRVEYVGERPDAAATLKLAGNAIILGICGVMADAFAIGKGGGIDGEAVLGLLDYFEPSRVAVGRGRAMMARAYEPGFELTMALKDVEFMQAAAGDAPLAILPALAARLRTLIDEGAGAHDLAVLGRDSLPKE
ncbi:MAG TPA: NAD(P)-dependent oxidoreductase [Gemmatimonadales bacterium]|nr:NAD(P)-dependent oxidoreductase [Gemmatimonadales bacterium]HRX19404.1 NAD(P)-dependent oxidoreductase [Gemmatimonadales bacterium]